MRKASSFVEGGLHGGLLGTEPALNKVFHQSENIQTPAPVDWHTDSLIVHFMPINATRFRQSFFRGSGGRCPGTVSIFPLPK